jgi:hypothetical protein
MAVVLAASPEAGLWQALAEVWIAAARWKFSTSTGFPSKGHKGSYADI